MDKVIIKEEMSAILECLGRIDGSLAMLIENEGFFSHSDINYFKTLRQILNANGSYSDGTFQTIEGIKNSLK